MLKVIQQISKSLILPISALPISAILLRLGQPELLNSPFLAGAGQIVFDNLPLLFAVAIAISFKDEDDSQTLSMSALIGYLIFTTCVNIIWTDKLGEAASSMNMATFTGVVVGLSTGYTYKYFKNTKLPSIFSFFSGHKLVPLIVSLEMMFMSFAFGNLWIYAQNAIERLSAKIVEFGALGAGIFAFLNRLLIPLGLHHVANSYFWNQYGEYNGVTGDIARFFAGDPTAGSYLVGFYPIMLFAFPAISLAIYQCAKEENKKKIAGILICLAGIAVVTGVTEPIEFLFIFTSPILLLIHALLTALSTIVLNMLGSLHGFTFSAGLIDYVFHYKYATNPLYILVVGVFIFTLYYVLFKKIIMKYNLPTIGREIEDSNASIKYNDIYSSIFTDIIKINGVDTNNVDEMKDSIRTILHEIKDISTENSTNSDSLLSTSEQINDSIGMVTKAMDTVLNINMNQSNILNDTIQSLTKFDESTSRFTSIVDYIGSESINAIKDTEISKVDLNNAASSLSEISTQLINLMNETREVMSNLKEVKNINEIIAGISSRTNMLSLNASIEAARVGAQGKGFAVIAETIRELSNESAVASKETNELILKIVESLNSTSNTTEALEKTIHIQLNNLSTAIKNLSIVLESFAKIKPKTEEALTEIDEFAGVKNEIVDKINYSVEESETIVASTQEVSLQMEKIKDYANNLYDVASSIQTSTTDLEKLSNTFQ